MKTEKEYPATHSMWTAWFAIDEDGNVAIMECDDNGPAPDASPREETSDSLILETLIEPKNRIRYTDCQLELMMRNAITPAEYVKEERDYENIWGDLCEIDPAKLPLIKEASLTNDRNKLICISEGLNLWYIEFSLPHYIDNSGDRRYRRTQQRVEENERSKALYKKILDEGAIKRMINVSWPLGYDEEDMWPEGCIWKENTPLTLYFQNYDSREPSERMHEPEENLAVKEHQLPESIRRSAIRLPLRFSDHEKIQTAEFVPSVFYGSNLSWTVDGNSATIAKLPDGKYYFVGDGCFFKPIAMDEAFESHDTRFKPYSSSHVQECRINGRRGFVRYWDGTYRKAGSDEIYEPKESDIIEPMD